MQRTVILTKDGSHSISVPELDVTYHSTHGAIQESQHVFIDAGLNAVQRTAASSLSILEMGLGTGLSVLLTLISAGGRPIRYTAIELYPLEPELINSLNYCQELQRMDLLQPFESIHSSEWNTEHLINKDFIFRKIKDDLHTVPLDEKFDLIYYDAFAPSVQPDLWITEIFRKLIEATAPGGILVTYCSKSVVRRAMKAAGWIIEKIPGPYGKREMVRAKKPI